MDRFRGYRSAIKAAESDRRKPPASTVLIQLEADIDGISDFRIEPFNRIAFETIDIAHFRTLSPGAELHPPGLPIVRILINAVGTGHRTESNGMELKF